jgi:hypothetical protein
VTFWEKKPARQGLRKSFGPWTGRFFLLKFREQHQKGQKKRTQTEAENENIW